MELLVYDYNATEGELRTAGSLKPSSQYNKGVLVSTVRWIDDPMLAEDLKAAPDFVFRATLDYQGDALPENSMDYPAASLPLKLNLWEVTVDFIKLAEGVKPDHTFHIHIFR